MKSCINICFFKRRALLFFFFRKSYYKYFLLRKTISLLILLYVKLQKKIKFHVCDFNNNVKTQYSRQQYFLSLIYRYYLKAKHCFQYFFTMIRNFI